MLKKVVIPALALLVLLIVVGAPQANAAVRFGVWVGGPAYGPVYPGYPYVYSDPYPYPYRTYHYARPYPFYYSAPVYSYPRYWRERRGREWREHERREWRERDGRYRR